MTISGLAAATGASGVEWTLFVDDDEDEEEEDDDDDICYLTNYLKKKILFYKEKKILYLKNVKV